MKREFRDVPGFVLQPCPLVFSNPTPGIVINRPNGSDVYEGVLKDYTGEDVTPQNFLAVLRGDEEAVKGKGSGKVLKR